MAQGLTNTGIAKRLFLTERTVEAHVRHVLLKLGYRRARTPTGGCWRCWRTWRRVGA